MDGIIGAIATAVMKWFAGWFSRREEAKATENAIHQQADATADAAKIDHATEVKLDESHAHTADAVDAVRHAGTDADGVRRQYELTKAAVDRANAGAEL